MQTFANLKARCCLLEIKFVMILSLFAGQGSFVVAGKVESGCIQNGDRVIAMPAAEAGIMKGNRSFPNFVSLLKQFYENFEQVILVF